MHRGSIGQKAAAGGQAGKHIDLGARRNAGDDLGNHLGQVHCDGSPVILPKIDLLRGWLGMPMDSSISRRRALGSDTMTSAPDCWPRKGEQRAHGAAACHQQAAAGF